MEGATETIPNNLPLHLVPEKLLDIWTPSFVVVRERELWISVLEEQAELANQSSEEALAAYRRVCGNVDLQSIRSRELLTKHDVKARIEEFCALAGHEEIHRGLTSADVRENIEQLQIVQSLSVIIGQADALAPHLQSRCNDRLAGTFGTAIEGVIQFIQTIPFRGIKGAVGTYLDQANLFQGNIKKAQTLETSVMAKLGANRLCGAIGQIYPRVLDQMLLAKLVTLVQVPKALALADLQHRVHGFDDIAMDQSEAGAGAAYDLSSVIVGLTALLQGYLVMTAEVAGDLWNEGDVSTSVVRRLALPNALFSTSAILTAATANTPTGPFSVDK